MSTELVDVLLPPDFKPSGEIKPVVEAINDGNWLGVMNLWIVRPGPALIYQERPNFGWEPGKFDGSVGGFYRAGEFGLDGLREAEEELGWSFSPDDIFLVGHRLSVGLNSVGKERRLVVTIFMTYDDSPLSKFKLDPREVPAIYEILLDDVDKSFTDSNYSFTAHGIDCNGKTVMKTASVKDFSYIFGGYHARIAEVARQFSQGKRHFHY